MKTYRTINMAAEGDFISGVTGSGTDFDVTLDDGTVIEEFDPAAGDFQTADPAAGMLCLFGLLTDSRAVTVANMQVLTAVQAAAWFDRKDLT